MNLFKENRVKMNLTQEELAKIIGIKRSQIANIETNYSIPSAKVMLKLMIILHINAIDLYNYYFNNNVN